VTVVQVRLVALALAALAGQPAARSTEPAARSTEYDAPSTWHDALSTRTEHGAPSTQHGLTTDLDTIFADPIFDRALVGVRVESLSTGEVLYERDAGRHVMPASNMKLVTLAVAAERFGWDFRFETRLEAAGPIRDGVLHGDLIVAGGGDPSIGSADADPSPLFAGWVVALREAGIRRINGRLVGDDDAFEDEGRGGGWSWDYLTAGYAAPSGALSYNENVAVIRVRPGERDGAPALVLVTPPGHGFDVTNEVTTVPAGSGRGTLSVARTSGSRRLVARGRIPAGANEIVRTTTVDNPTLFFVRSLAATLAAYGLTVRDGAWDIDELETPVPAGERRVVVRQQSPPLSALAGYLMKVSQNFYAETMLKTIGLAASGAGSESAGRRAVRDTLASWGIPEDAVVVYDGSGLSRYNYVTAGAIVEILRRMWESDVHRGPFLATLPVGGHDGTLASRMRNTDLARHVQAKTGSIANVRALSGYLDRPSGEKLVFSIIANHFTAPSRQVDALVERALARLVH
jgi:D-alanyl-D-alanine carboxypeptidase/D-alanyl-D-alanine-endopeptidase (penicillin-binding protein 4)